MNILTLKGRPTLLKNKHRYILFLLLILVAFGVTAQQRAIVSLPSAERLRADVTYLASDKLEGRRTGTEGARMAGRYIADEFKQLGLRPAISTPVFTGTDKDNAVSRETKTYMQPFPYVAGVD